MEEIIREELFTEVLNIQFDWLQNIKLEGSILTYEKHYESFRGDSCSYWSDEEINIYELAHKCKEWAMDKGYYTESGLTGKLAQCLVVGVKHFLADTEPEAIFKACEWILKQKATNV